MASCDIAVASEKSRFATPGVNIGLFCSTPAVAVGRSLPRKVGSVPERTVLYSLSAPGLGARAGMNELPSLVLRSSKPSTVEFSLSDKSLDKGSLVKYCKNDLSSRKAVLSP